MSSVAGVGRLTIALRSENIICFRRAVINRKISKVRNIHERSSTCIDRNKRHLKSVVWF